jgi:hypothetical protein
MRAHVPGESAGAGEAAGAELACVLRHGERACAFRTELGELSRQAGAKMVRRESVSQRESCGGG